GDMTDQEWLAERFEAERPHLRGVAYRMLGSLAEADDAVQETWIRLSRTDTTDVDDLRAWLTTVVARVGLALLVVLESLTPSERVAFVLHDVFAVPFDKIAPIVGRTPTATRQLASR